MNEPVIVTGARSLVGHRLLPRLEAAGFQVQALSRRRGSGSGATHWLELDLAALAVCRDPVSLGLRPSVVLVHLAPLWLLPPVLPAFARLGVRRLVAFSSTSRLTKAHARAAIDRRLAARLARAEQEVIESSDANGIDWTLLRPTLIYGNVWEGGLGRLARVAAACRFIPVVGEASGTRQPVHADDLATACVAVLGQDVTFGQTYDLAGATRVTHLELCRVVLQALGLPPRVVRVPASVARGLLRVLRRVPRFSGISVGAADRMNEDLCVDSSPAVADFGYSPRAFALDPVFPDTVGVSGTDASSGARA
jgi:nucleoside-diphosphate-sugar epimerase